MKRVVLFLCIALSGLGAWADENVLQTIEVNPVKDTYNIVLVSDRAVDVKKTVIDSNKIDIVLKDIRASKTLNTIYNNVSNVDTVMVEPQGDGVKIFFQAENAEKTTVTFDALMPAVTPAPVNPKKAARQSIKLSNPIESYAPIYNENAENIKTSNLFNRLKASSKVAEIKDTFDETSSEDTANKMISFGLVGLLVFAIAKLFRKKEPEMKIGLSNKAYEQPAVMNTGMNDMMSLGAPKPFTTVNYGLNAYKNENRNPYETAPMTFHNPKLQALAQQQMQQQMQQVMQQAYSQPVQATQTATMTKPAAKKMTTPVNTAPVNQSNPNVDNLKFLESMTAIYEKSGRHDLAMGLKASLSKNNIK